MKRHILAYLFLAASLMMFPAISWAYSFSCSMDDVYSGPNPTGSGPWLKATFQDDGTDKVLLTLTALNLKGPEYVSDWFFNFNPSISLSKLSFTYQTGVAPTSYSTSQNGEYAGGPGYAFDIKIADPNYGNTFGPGDTSTILITGINGLTNLDAADFDYTFNYYGESYLAGAEIQNTDTGWCDNGTTYIGGEDPDPSPAPEPSTLLILGSGLIGLVGAGKKIRKA